jgi:ketosteroid isomerase-like protein
MAPSPIDIVRSLYDAFGRRDVQAVFALFSPEIEITQSPELPWGGRYHGHDGAGQFFAKLTSHINSIVEIERLIASGEQVTVIGWTQGTVNATGAKFRVPIAHIWTLRDGRVVQVQFLIDNPTMLAALGGGTA